MYADRVYYHGSSLIESTKYDHEHHELEVVFHNGEVRVHEEVPSAKAHELESYADGKSGSAGDYYRDHIKDSCPVKKNG